MEDVSYTTEEVAKLLRVSKLTVYDLIKKGGLPAYRVGKQMRIDATDLEAYKQRAKTGGGAGGAASGVSSSGASAPPPLTGQSPSAFRPLVVTGQDSALDLLASALEKRSRQVRPLRSFVGSMDSLIAMYRGEADIVSTHLFDGATGTYNLPYIEKLLMGFPYLVVNLASRRAGLYARKGNPLGLSDWTDLARPTLTLVNREKGSGARVLLEEQLRIHGIRPRTLRGYAHEESSHLAVAGTIARGDADVGVGIEKAAALVGIDFIPLIQERVDLVMLQHPHNQAWIAAVLDILRSEAFRTELQSLGGYDLALTGTVMGEG